MFCTKCGNEIPEDSQFCSRCGERIPTPLQDETFTYKEYFRSLFRSSGTISRKDFRTNILIILSVQIVACFIISAASGGPASLLACILLGFTLVPMYALTVRRVRDAGCSVAIVTIFILITAFLAANTIYHAQRMTETYRRAEILKQAKTKVPPSQHEGFDYEGWMKGSDLRRERAKEIKRLRKEADDHSRLCYNYRIAAVATPLIFYGVLFLLPSRKKSLKK